MQNADVGFGPTGGGWLRVVGASSSIVSVAGVGIRVGARF
jgi:hypothetical protein